MIVRDGTGKAERFQPRVTEILSLVHHNSIKTEVWIVTNRFDECYRKMDVEQRFTSIRGQHDAPFFCKRTAMPMEVGSYSRKFVMALIGGLSWRCSHAAILSREKDMPHDEVYHHAVARSIGIFV